MNELTNLEYRSLVTQSIQDEDVVVMASMLDERLKERGVVITEELGYFFVTSLYLMKQSQPMTHPVLLNAPCGSGKSTLIEVFGEYMVQKHSETFGMIIVKDKLSQVDETVEQLNKLAGKPVAFGLKGYSKELFPDKADYMYQFKEQEKFPILVITQQMLANRSHSRSLHELGFFYNEDNQKMSRRHLHIDEKPQFTKQFSFTEETLHKFFLDVKAVMKGRKLPKQFHVAYKMLRNVLETHDDKISIVEPISEKFFVTPDIRSAWEKHYEGNDFTTLHTFEQLISKGGYVETNQKGHTSITFTSTTLFEFTTYNTFIFDGTGHLDSEYLTHQDRLILSRPQEVKEYQHVTFKLNDQHSFSRTFFQSNESAFQGTIQMVKYILPQHKSTMVVVYQSDLKKYEQAFADEIASGKVKLKHFDTGRSSNDYRDCDSAIFIGWLLKPSSQYLSKTSAIIDELVEPNHIPHKSKGIVFDDDRVNQFRMQDIVLERVQDIERLRLGSSDDKKTIYLFHKDSEFLEKIVEQFPKSKKEQFTIVHKLTDTKETHEDRLIQYFSEMKSGEKVKGREIYEQLQIDKFSFSKILKQPRVIQAMTDSGIYKQGHSIVKE